jgi:tRNA A58 N-methylase Trm61
MKLRIDEQLSIIAAGIGGGALAHLVALYVLPLLSFSEEFIHGIASQNIRIAIFTAGFLFEFLLSLLNKRVLCLDIPDDYEFMDPVLVRLPQAKVSRFLPNVQI